MPLTRDYTETIQERIQEDSEFAVCLLEEAIMLSFNGEPNIARLVLRNLVNATIGFEELAVLTSKPSKSLHRMLSAKGNPTMDNLTSIVAALQKYLNVGAFDVSSIPASCEEKSDATKPEVEPGFVEQLQSA